MRRLVAVAMVLVLATGVSTTTVAHAGVYGELDAFADALDDLASATENVGVAVERAPTSRLGTLALVAPLGELRAATTRVAATGVPVADHLARERLSAQAAGDALAPAVRALASASQDLSAASPALTAQLWGRPVAAAAGPSTGELLAPAIQAVAAALETLAPALEALAPVVEPLAPVVGPACGQVPGIAFLALGLAPVLVPVPLPSLPEPPAVIAGSILAPAFLLCAALPLPGLEQPDDGEDAPAPDGFGGEAASAPPAPPIAPAVPRSAPPVLADDSPAPRSLAGAVRAPAPGPAPEARSSVASPPARPVVPAPASVTNLPLLPVDHDGEATGITLLVLAAAAAAAAATFLARRRQGSVDWRLPAAAAAGIGAVAAGGMAWSGAAEQLSPWAQVPYLISGGMTAFVLGLVGLTLGLAPSLARLAARRD